MWLLGTEFRALNIEPGQVVAFIPGDSEGRKRDGVTIRFYDSSAATTAGD